jgi:hypothetical protein
MSITVTLHCPNDDCEAEVDVDVSCSSPYRPARLVSWENSSPEEDAEYVIEGLSTCPTCGADMDDLYFYTEAIARAEAKARDDV